MPNIPISPRSCCHSAGQCPAYTLHPIVPNRRSSPIFEENFDDLGDVEDILDGSFSQIFPTTWFNVNVSSGILDFTIAPTIYWNGIQSVGFRRASYYDIDKARVYSFDIKLTDPISGSVRAMQQITLETALCGPAVITQLPPNPPIAGAIEKPTRTVGIQFERTSVSEVYFYLLNQYPFNTLNSGFSHPMTIELDSGVEEYSLSCDEADFFNIELINYSPQYDDLNIFTYVYTDVYINTVLISTIKATLLPYNLGAPFNGYQKAEIDSCLGIMDFRRWRNLSIGGNMNRVYIDKISCSYL